MIVRARFIGKSSCGFLNGSVYELNLAFGEKRIWAFDTDSKACCPYASLQALAANWQIPVKDTGEKYGASHT